MHAGKPLIALDVTDRIGQMTRAQHRMAKALDVVCRPAEEPAEEPEELVAIRS